MNSFTCRHLTDCSGCFYKDKSFSEQVQLKKTEFRIKFLEPYQVSQQQVKYLFPIEGYHRHRNDFISYENKIGLYSIDKKLIPIDSCSLMSSELNDFFHYLQTIPFGVKKGTIRLRHSPSGLKGVWLDFANTDIKRLIDQQLILGALLEQNIIVEIGQKGKKLYWAEGKLKLANPEPFPWFKTYFKKQPHDLYSLVSSFTQPSFELNLLLQQEISSWFDLKNFNTLIEFGSGVGNFSLFLSDYCESLILLETDPRNLIALDKNIKASGLTTRTAINPSNKYTQGTNIKENKIKTETLIFVNPPRSGVGNLFDKDPLAHQIIYVSCYLDSKIKDLDKLIKYGFKVNKTILFDQFPQSRHFESVTYLTRSN